MILNEATMIEAVQYWLANKVLNKDEIGPKITSVKATMATSGHREQGTFIVTLVRETGS
jgi:hypothetical protein